MDTKYVLNKLVQRFDLTSTESKAFLEGVMDGSISHVQTGAILTALRIKNESVDEIVGFIQTMRGHMLSIKAHNAIDLCGTGGDGVGTFNVSTAVSFVVAASGVNVAKHGNRAASSQCGSADVLETLGVNIMLKPQEAEQILKTVGMVYLFAPLYHPATKNVVAVRKELKISTIFNFLGPFLNPALTKRQLIGVSHPEIAKKLAEVGKRLQYKHLLIVNSADGLDEISISSSTTAYEVKDAKITTFTIDPKQLGFKKAQLASVLGADAKRNAQIIHDVLTGTKGPKRDIVVLNAAAALYVAGRVKNINDGIDLAKKSIDSGKAKQVLENLIKTTQKYA